MPSDLFKTHLLNESGKDKARRVGAMFDSLLDGLRSVCPEGRELALVQTKLEEACFFAKKSIARQSQNQEGYYVPPGPQDPLPPPPGRKVE